MEDDINIEVDEDLIKDFFDEYADAEEALHAIVLEVDADPQNLDHIHALFRTVHTIKGNLRMMGLGALSELVHYFETLLDEVRQGSRTYDHGMSDILILLSERLRDFSQLAFTEESNESTEEEIEALRAVLQQLGTAERNDIDGAVRSALKTLDPGGNYDEEPDEVVPAFQIADASGDSDIEFFQRLIEQVESCVPYWEGRSARILDMCLSMNEMAGGVVETDQLKAAVYLHDIGMSFFPTYIMSKPEELDEQETKIMQNHSQLGYEWLRRIPGWEMASIMILQHHERPDSDGYPNGLTSDNIHDGAKIIIIADTYEAMTHSRAHRANKRPELRAILEINGGSEAQFDADWVEHFNQVVRSKKHLEEL